MLGLPLGNVTIKSMPYREVTDDMITVWRKQFDDEDNIRPRAVQQVIMQSTCADLLFKVNIFVLLCNTLGQSMSMGTCDLSMLSKVTKDLDLSDIDWCGYVFDYLKETKSAWNPNSKKGFYVGPIILLLGNDVGGVKSSGRRCKGNQGEEIFSGSGESVEEYADFANRSGRKSFKTTPPSKMEMLIPLPVVPFNNDEHWLSRRAYRPRMKSEYLKSPYIIRAVDIIKGVP
ncbi:unnamed protein product [Lactuca saligna]|uniref:Uncharacterized protein n=1 Tax=Lactuca saligna TaxID=75948 RepID=A0AA36E5D8_LACSI|nr:unnamed protein product [Lactuca saligna]